MICSYVSTTIRKYTPCKYNNTYNKYETYRNSVSGIWDTRCATADQLSLKLLRVHLLVVSEIIYELHKVPVLYTLGLELVEAYPRICGGDLLAVDHRGLLHPLVTLGQRDVSAVTACVTELGERFEHVLQVRRSGGHRIRQ